MSRPLGRRRPGRFLRALRLAGWNALFAVAALAFAAGVGEAWFRLQAPFWIADQPTTFHPKVGLLGRPGAEVRWTNRLDFWTVSRTNALGFLDREPPNPERVAAGCRIAMFGDSIVEAREVPIADKFHVLLEEMAARELPHLGVATSAFGRVATGQVAQLAFYDEFARRLRPKVLVLVFYKNDFTNNSPILNGVWTGWDPDRQPYVSARRGPDGAVTLRPPAPDWRKHRLPRPAPSLWERVEKGMARASALADWLRRQRQALFPGGGAGPSRTVAWAELLSRRPGGEGLLEGWRPTTRAGLQAAFGRETLPPFFEASLEFTAFALDRFAERARRDGAALLVLATHTMGGRGHPLFERLAAMAEARNIPVIDQAGFILRRGARIEDAHWTHDEHWNAAGHRWAAEALLDRLKRHPHLCDGAAAEGS